MDKTVEAVSDSQVVINNGIKKVMVIEPNPFHGEVIPGVVNYLIELGYHVDLYIRKELANERIARILPTQIEIIEYQISDICSLFTKESTSKYDFVFFTSYEYQIDGKIVNFCKYYNLDIAARYGILGIYHTVFLIDWFHDEELFESGRVFFLSDFQKYNGQSHTLNPHYFSEAKHGNNKKDNSQTVITVLGNVCDYKQIGRALACLTREEKKRITLLHTGRGIDGIEHIKRAIKYALYSVLSFSQKYRGKKMEYNIKELGRVDFQTLIETVLTSDYLLLTIDENSDEGRNYVTNSTSGTKQLSLGLNIPIIVNRDVGKTYGFDDRNALFYDGDDLEKALKYSFSNSRYHDMLDELARLSDDIYQNSLETLKQTIETIIHNEDTTHKLY